MKKLFVTLLVSAGLISQTVYAYECTGKISRLVVSPNSGMITVSFGNIGWVYLCSVSQAYNGVQPDTCRASLSILLAAQLADKNVSFWFNDSSNNCTNASHPAWADLTNWYYGPTIITP